MLEISRLRNELNHVKKALSKRGWNDEKLSILDRVIELDDKRKRVQSHNDQLLNERNQISKLIGQLFKEGKQEEANSSKSKVEALKKDIASNEENMSEIKAEIENLLLSVPNAPNSLVPNGLSEDDNQIVKDWEGPLPELSEDALPHWELGKKYDILDFEIGVKLTGAGFPVFRKKGSKLQRALINFFLDEANNQGYEEIVPPLLVNADSARGTGNLPDKEGQMYHITKDEFYLIPTAEVPVTNIHRNDILGIDQLPVKMTAYTPCFRREAGSYGADVKGLNRVHQFDKIEIVQITHPEQSYKTLDNMVSYVETLLSKLELPYRILRLCGGDLTYASALTYDFEVYSAAQKKWLEVSSVSNFETYQSNRLKLRFKDTDGKNKLAHTLNGSALALARIIASILENNQTADGIKMPEALRSYTGFDILN